jgi:hypothetical protein
MEIGGAAWTFINTGVSFATFLTGCIGNNAASAGTINHLRLDIKRLISTSHLQKPHRNCTRKSMSSKESYNNQERDLKE